MAGRHGHQIAGVCRDPETGQDHILQHHRPVALASWPNTSYLYYDAAGRQLVEGFNDRWEGRKMAKPGADGVCRWRRAKAAVEAANAAHGRLLAGQPWEVPQAGSFAWPPAIVPPEVAEEALAVLRGLPPDVAKVIDGPESDRWQVVTARRAYGHRWGSHREGALLARNKTTGGWFSLLDCYYARPLDLEGDTLLFDVRDSCDSDTVMHRVMLELGNWQAETVRWRCGDSLADCQRPLE